METETRPVETAPAGHPAPGLRKRRRRWPWVVAALLAVLAVGFAATRKPKPDDTKTAVAERRDIRQVVTATGSITLQTAAEVKIGAEVSGKVKRLYVDVGDTVHPGQLIAELDNPESDAILQQSRAQVDSAAARIRENQANVARQQPEITANIARAQSEVRAAEARYRQALLAARNQPDALRADIERAEADVRVEEQTLAQSRAETALNVESAQAAVESAQAQLDKAANDVRRARELVAKGYISQSDADAAETAQRVDAAELASRRKALAIAQASNRNRVAEAVQRLAAARARLRAARTGTAEVGIKSAQAEAARAEVENARNGLKVALAARGAIGVLGAQGEETAANLRQVRADYERQSKNHDKLRIYSPIAGIVTSVDTKEGETVTAGFQTPTLLTIANLERIQVELPVDETDIGKLDVGQPATVTVDAFPNNPLKGRVTKVAAGATVENNVVTYKCTVAIDRATVALKPRMTATVNVETGIVKNAVAVPLDALKTAGDNDVVYFAPEPSKNAKQQGRPTPFKEQVVRTGASDDKFIQVVSGLKPGDRVVVSSTRLDAQRQKQGA